MTLLFIYLLVELALSIAIVILNGTFFIVLLKKTSLHTPSNAALGCLWFSDLLMGILSLSVCLMRLHMTFIDYLSSFEIYIAVFRAYYVIISLSSLCMILVTLDRYAAICHPFKYLRCATTKRNAIICISTCFIYAVLVGIACIMDEIFQFYTETFLFNAILICTLWSFIYCNYKILRVIRRHRRAIASVERYGDGSQTRFRREAKRYHALVLLLILFVLLKLPGIVNFFLRWTVKFHMSLAILSLICEFLLLLNSLLNPLAYYFSMGILRTAFKDMFCCRGQS